ncbi:MAG: ABC-type transport auxiliary lipoprotein family protein [Hydrogenimonas sp.]|nr:ABC-type transport auxiliary lipoprotein family protein [Hydrogenimonas sp.]
MLKRFTLITFALLLLNGCAAKRVPSIKEYYISKAAPKFEERVKVKKRLSSLKLIFTDSSKTAATSNIYYIKNGYRRQPYSYSRWYDTVERMFEEKLLNAINISKISDSVAGSYSIADADLLLEISILDFVHDFSRGETSEGRVVLQATLLQSKDAKVVASKLFEAAAPAPQPNASGGVAALNSASDTVTKEILQWLSSVEIE